MTGFNASSIPADDFRVDYLEEARECIRASNRILKRYPNTWHEIPAYWANLMGAVANANIAGVSNDVAYGMFVLDENRRQENKRIRDMLDEKLKK